MLQVGTCYSESFPTLSLSIPCTHTHSLCLERERERERERECAPTTVKHCQKFHSVFGVHLKKVRFSQIHPREGSYFVFKKEHFAQKQNVHPYKLIVWDSCLMLGKVLGWECNQNAGTASAAALDIPLSWLMPSTLSLTYRVKQCQKFHRVFGVHLRKVRSTCSCWRDELTLLRRNMFLFWNVHPHTSIRGEAVALCSVKPLDEAVTRMQALLPHSCYLGWYLCIW
jgi:hypothetical protein